jgi:hypothetical protein
VVCAQCETKIGAKDTPLEKRRCPDIDCPGAAAGIPFKTVPFSSQIIMKQMRTNKILHNCKLGLKDYDPSESYFFPIKDLFTHILNDCMRKENICPNCGIEFLTVEETMEHLRKDCLYATMTCHYCNEKMYRGEFKQHHCFDYAS